MNLPSKYQPAEAEKKWYSYWMEHRYFNSTPDEKPPYTVVIPPPNVTGVLHMGHMLNNTIQDVLVRRARLLGYNACWVPGTDHASIATEAKVVAQLKSEGTDKITLGRAAFLERAWQWTDKHGGIILKQLKKLGCSCDWDRTRFTLEPELSASVIKVFVDLYAKGLIYRDYRMVNWDPQARTTLSDEEVIYREQSGKLYYLNYPIENSNEFLTIATTRPETILGDTAVCVNPNDKRYAHLKGKKVIVPVCNRSVPVIFDAYVDMEFGTGCLKVTPAHDINDYELGVKHQLEHLNIFNEDGTLNELGLHYKGHDRFDVRKKITSELQQNGYLVRTEDYNNKVGTSERTGAVIEPRLSVQWFLKMKDLAEPALEAVTTQKSVKLFPKKFENTYRHWLENIRDWNISRQLWWGHQIPAWYYGEGQNDFVVAETRDAAAAILHNKYTFDSAGFEQAYERGNISLEALNQARDNAWLGNIKPEQLRQDNDVLDTWFSSWLWPISVFNGILEPDNKDINYYYPTRDLVTAPDIIFFWVARMIMAGYEFRKKQPFDNVYFTGLVRDKQRRKMSKQLGNSPDALKLIADYGADAVRMGLLLSAPAGNDLMFDTALCEQGRQFANKIWNSFRLINGWQADPGKKQPEASKIAVEWYAARFNEVLKQLENEFSKFRLSQALMAIYKLIWDDYCSWFLEIIKPPYQQPIDALTLKFAKTFLENNLKILHPFMPFLTEEIWQLLKDRSPEEALIISQWPETKNFDKRVITQFSLTTQVISAIRKLRKENNISNKDPLKLFATGSNHKTQPLKEVVIKLANISHWEQGKPETNFKSFLVADREYYIPWDKTEDHRSEIDELQKELNYSKGFLKGVQKKLGNDRFVNNAPEKVVSLERKKEQDTITRIGLIEKRLKELAEV